MKKLHSFSGFLLSFPRIPATRINNLALELIGLLNIELLCLFQPFYTSLSMLLLLYIKFDFMGENGMNFNGDVVGFLLFRANKIIRCP